MGFFSITLKTDIYVQQFLVKTVKTRSLATEAPVQITHRFFTYTIKKRCYFSWSDINLRFSYVQEILNCIFKKDKSDIVEPSFLRSLVICLPVDVLELFLFHFYCFKGFWGFFGGGALVCLFSLVLFFCCFYPICFYEICLNF